MTTSKNKAVGSAAEREVAKLLGGVRVGMDGGPVDVVIPEYASIQVKKLLTQPSLQAIGNMLAIMPKGLLRGVVIITRKGQGIRGQRNIVFDLDEWAAWHGKG